MFSPRTASKTAQPDYPEGTSIILASEIGMEYSSLKVARNNPSGMYITPSPDNILNWNGVMFLRKGPYANAILRFTITFPTSFPYTPPSVRFDTEVFHPMIDPKTMVWTPHGAISQWQPRVHHVAHLLHNLKQSFNSSNLAKITEDEAVNKHLWSLYTYSNHTFLSMTAQRSLHSSSQNTLFANHDHDITSEGISTPPTSPTRIKSPPPLITRSSTPTKGNSSPLPPTPIRSVSAKIGSGSIRSWRSGVEEGSGPIKFRKLEKGEEERLWDLLKKSVVRVAQT